MNKVKNKRFFKSYKKILEDNKFTITEEWYPDGYLIADDHKMWTFKLKECPDWLFGIWADKEEESGDKNYYLIRVFAQPENYIDKFKPAASRILNEVVVGGKKSEWEKEEILKVFKYVRNNPYLAWYQDVHFTNYNLEYISPKTAKREFKKSERERKLRIKIEKRLDAEETAWIKNKLDEMGEKYKILTEENCYPRHTVLLEDKTVGKKVWANLIPDDDWLEFEKIVAKYDKKYHPIHFYSNFDNVALLVKKIKRDKNE